MAIMYLRTSILKAGSGKSAIASAAYQSASVLHDEKLDMTFQYRNKEEVVFSEILLPTNAPSEYADRETLWNAVEAKENKANSRLSRKFVFAIPKEWDVQQAIQWSREFLQRELVDKGMVVDWAYHNKPDNPHVHVMATVRGFTEKGSWAQMEKKEFALDSNGDRIPEIDPETGEQKIRVRTRNGQQSTERLWKHITVMANEWNSKKFLVDLKHSWASFCNERLSEDQHISAESYEDRGILQVPMLHEGPEARAALERGVVFDVVAENQERAAINQRLSRIQIMVNAAKETLARFITRIEKWRQGYGQRHRPGTVAGDGRNAENHRPAATVNPGLDSRAGTVQQFQQTAAELTQATERVHKHKHRHR